MSTLPKMYSTKQISDMLGVTEQTVREWLKSGEMKGLKVGGRGQWRVSEDDLNNYLKERHG